MCVCVCKMKSYTFLLIMSVSERLCVKERDGQNVIVNAENFVKEHDRKNNLNSPVCPSIGNGRVLSETSESIPIDLQIRCMKNIRLPIPYTCFTINYIIKRYFMTEKI